MLSDEINGTFNWIRRKQQALLAEVTALKMLAFTLEEENERLRRLLCSYTDEDKAAVEKKCG